MPKLATTQIWRCSDGHLYRASWPKAVLLSVHLGLGTHFQRCPVDGRWRRATRVADPGTLSPSDRAEADAHTF